MTPRRVTGRLPRRRAARRPRRGTRAAAPPVAATPRARRARLILLIVAFGAGLLSLGARCAHLQIFRAGDLIDRARSQQERSVTLHPYRGPILDRNGRELALSLAVDSVYADPSSIDDPAGAARRLSRAVGIKPSVLAERLRDRDRQFVWITRKITPEQRAAIEELAIDGIGFVRESRRYYPKRELASHVLGACGVDNQGLSGLEFSFDRSIGGTPGRMLFLQDGRGGKVLDRSRTEPIPGAGLVLTLDSNIQHIAERELAAAIRKSGAASGAVVVLQPGTGEVLAMANHPTFDPNAFPDAPERARRNIAVSDFYEPGSTFKPVVAAAVLDSGRARPNETIWCENGSIVVGRHRFREDSRPFGNLTFTEVLARSSNVGAIKLARRLDPSELFDAIVRFGFGEKTGIELPGESPGMLRDPGDWSGLSHASLAIGQEIGITPLQMAAAIAAIANDGVRVPPRVVRARIDPSGRRPRAQAQDAPGMRRVIAASAARALRRMMLSITADEATGRLAAVPGYSIGGKTGTAQKVDEETGRYSRTRHVAWFAGLAPVERPAIAIVVMINEPRGPRFHGGDVAAPVFSRIARPVLQYLNVPPDRDGTLVFDRAPAEVLVSGAPEEPPAETAASLRRGRRSGRASGRTAVMEASIAGAAGTRRGAMPDLVGMSLRRATEVLASSGLTCRVTRRGANVTGQKPAAGTPIRPGDPCSVVY